MNYRKKEFTIYDIAQQLNLSPATISRGLKNHPAISEDTKKRIVEYAKSVGYQANKFARALRNKTTSAIGVIVPKLDSQFMSSALAGMEKVANSAGYNLIISQSLETEAKEIENAEIMFNNRVDGLIVSLSFNTRDISHFKPFSVKGIPIIFFDRTSDDLNCPTVEIDNFKAGYEATKHLIDQGSRRIMHITGNLQRNVYTDRFDGYKRALTEAGIEFSEDLTLLTRLDIEAGVSAGRQIVTSDPMPDGIFVANDLCAVACMQALKKEGVRIPEDIAIVGFNNDPITGFVEPNLSTIDYPSQQMGEAAAKRLIDILTRKTSVIQKSRVYIQSKLIIRESSVRKTKNA